MGAGFRRLGAGGRPKRGESTGPNPTDRGKSGAKRHLVVDQQGLPLAVLNTAANTADCKMFIETLDAIPFKRRPVKVHADKGYDSQALRDALHERGILDRIARRRVDSSEKLGCYRWVVERTHSWLNGFRRLKIRYERKAAMHQALLVLGCALICFRVWQRF